MTNLPHYGRRGRTTYVLDNEIRHGHAVEDGVLSQEITRNTDPREVFEYMKTIVSLYESDVDSTEELPLFVDILDNGEVYVRDNEGGEYVMWAAQEWTAPKPTADPHQWNPSDDELMDREDTGLNTNTIYAVFNAIKFAYEEPERIDEMFDRVQNELVT